MEQSKADSRLSAVEKNLSFVASEFEKVGGEPFFLSCRQLKSVRESVSLERR